MRTVTPTATRLPALAHTSLRWLLALGAAVVLTVVLVSGIGAVVGTVASGGPWPPSNDRLAIEEVVRGAAMVPTTELIPPADYTGGPVPSAVAADLRTRIRLDLERWYTGDRLDELVRVLTSNLDLPQPLFDRASGLRSFSFAELSIDGDEASVQATYRVWVLSVRPDAVASAAPTRLESTWQARFHLVRRNGQWRVDVESDSRCLQDCP